MSNGKDAVHDFDFLVGEWKIKNRRLKERLKGSDEWIEFEADYVNFPILLGKGNLDRFTTSFDGKPFEGVSLRLFKPETGEWKIYWIASNLLQIGDPVVGKFVDGVGEFFADSKWEEQDIRVRFRWYDVETEIPKWAQAFSRDGGETWETNWIMEFERK